jgi:diguanylate cyclase (GGDEF)-like protein
MPNQVSLKAKLIAIVGLILFLPTVGLNWYGESIIRESIRNEKIRDVGAIASIKRDILVSTLRRLHAQNLAVLKAIESDCPLTSDLDIKTCESDMLRSLISSQGAEGASLSRPGRNGLLTLGNVDFSADRIPDFKPGQIAVPGPRVSGDDRLLSLAVSEPDEGAVLVVAYPVSRFQEIFFAPATLGQGGETFLADADGFFITKARYPAEQGHSVHISAVPMERCLGEGDGEMLELDYRAAPIIHGFRQIPEIGGGCIMAHIEQAEAFAQVDSLRKSGLGILLANLALLMLATWFLARTILRPMANLLRATGKIIDGDYSFRVEEQVGGLEISTLARSFNRMTERLHITLDELRENNAQLEMRVKERSVELQAANQQLLILSTTDALTGLANRRQFDSILDKEWRRAQRQGIPIALVLTDVDHFKLFNDTYGHQGGDECLRRIASVLADHAQRAGDLAARYGGEEFAIIMPGADPDDALAWAEAVRQAVMELGIPHKHSQNGIVTLSAGISSMQPAEGLSPADLIAQADKALYHAKEMGRNQVQVKAAE